MRHGWQNHSIALTEDFERNGDLSTVETTSR